jgi:hypothetical protein
MRTTGLEDMEAYTRIRGQKISNVRYADDITLRVENDGDLVELTKRVKNKSERAGVSCNPKKIIVMSTGVQVNIFVDSEEISTVTSYKFSGAVITKDSYTKGKIKRSLGKATLLW